MKTFSDKQNWESYFLAILPYKNTKERTLGWKQVTPYSNSNPHIHTKQCQ